MENNFIKLNLADITKGLNAEELIILSFIKSHQQNNQDFYYTDEQLIEIFGFIKNICKIQRILLKLENNGYITRTTTKQYYNDTKKYGNRRIITVNEIMKNEEKPKQTTNKKATTKPLKIEVVQEQTTTPTNEVQPIEIAPKGKELTTQELEELLKTPTYITSKPFESEFLKNINKSKEEKQKESGSMLEELLNQINNKC